MSGYIARKGFRYQDLYLLLRVLEATGSAIEEGWTLGSPNLSARLESPSLRFGIEGTSPSGSTTAIDWDVLIESPTELELAELKSGAVNRDDRLAFWRRLRREGKGGLIRVRPTLVVDPDTAGQIDYFGSLADTARKSSLPTPESFDGNVTSADKLFKEAIWALCEPGTVNGQPLDPKLAQETLSHFSLQTLRAADLEDRVEAYIEIFFPPSHASLYEPALTGWLGKRATTPDPQRRFFALRELFADIGILTISIAFDAARLHVWQTLWSDLPGVVERRTRGRLGQSGAIVPSRDIQPAAVEALTAGAESLLIRGIGGAGKSTFLAQAVESARARGNLVFWCGADDINLPEVDSIIEMFRFRSSLFALRNPVRTACLFVDGLDEAVGDKRARWAELLPRMATGKGERAIASVRDSVFSSDGNLRKKLETWTTLDLGEWPAAVIESLLNATPYADKLPLSVLSLLRTPILLDLFWRTFVENPAADLNKATKLHSRHELIAEFWVERLINSERHGASPGRAPALLAVFNLASQSIGAFQAPEDSAISLLQSEGLLIVEGRLQPRFNFRHPLLRDFAFAQWCLSASSSTEAARRWSAIAGGLQRYGALRALVEALSVADAESEYPAISLPTFLLALINHEAPAAMQIARLLGSLSEAAGFEPSRWPSGLQLILPPDFATAVVSAAKYNENPSWAASVASWPITLPWVDEPFLQELWRYTEMLLEKSKRDPSGPWQSPLKTVARRLRTLADDARFATSLAAAQEWLNMSITNCVAQALPDLETLMWLERRLPPAGWRVRHFMLDYLPGLARVDATRAAGLLRNAIGLGEKNGEPYLDPERWNSPMSDHNLNSALAGKGTALGLLMEFPAAFFPVALDLAQALLTFKHGPITDGKNLTKDSATLIDDQPRWSYWAGFASGDVRLRCLRAIHDKAKEVQQADPAFFYSQIVLLLRRSRLATVQSFALDLLLEQKADLRSLSLLREAVVDARLFAISGMDHWQQQLLLATWPSLGSAEREKVQDTITSLLKNECTTRQAKRLLACLPTMEWRPELAAQRPADDAPESRATPRPRREEDETLGRDAFALIPEPEAKDPPGKWPVHFDRTLLLQLHNSSDELRKSDATPATIRRELPAALASGTSLAALLKVDFATLTEEDNAWIWDAFEKTLAAYHKLREQPDTPLPPPEFVRACTDLGMAVLKDIPTDLPGKLPDTDVWMGFHDNAWTRALGLLDEALVWEPAQNDHALQAEFIALIERAFANGSPLLQLVCATRIRPFHWLRTPERSELYRRLVWETPSDARVPQWSVGVAARADDPERTEIYRVGLNRGNFHQAKDLASRIGEFLGFCSLLVMPTGQRSTAVGLIEEVMAAPSRFHLLHAPESQCEFWHHFAFGLKEQAMRKPLLHHLTADYGRWMYAAWKAMRRCQTKNRSEIIILFATHWMERKDSTDAQLLLPWWESVQPLLSDVIAEGSAADCFNIFFNFRDGPFNHLATPAELLGFVDRFVDRITTAVTSNQLDLDAKAPAEDEHNSWRECANYAAQAVDSLSKEGLLQTEILRDHAHRVLTRLAAAPIQAPDAPKALHALQRD